MREVGADAARPLAHFLPGDEAGAEDELGLVGEQARLRVERLALLEHVAVLSEVALLAGIPTVSLWAAVPHYVAQAPSPKAQLALLHRIEELLQVPLDTHELAEESAAWERGVDELATEDPEIAAYVRQLEEAKDTADLPEASGESIAREFERYLKRRHSSDEP